MSVWPFIYFQSRLILWWLFVLTILNLCQTTQIGLNDQARSDTLDAITLNARMQAQQNDFEPLVRIYNVYWSGIESNIMSDTNPIQCPTGTTMYPATQQEMTQMRYNKYRCMTDASITGFQNTFSINRQFGLQNAVVLWTSPQQYIDPNCQGVGGTIRQLPCVPMDQFESDWQDWMTFVSNNFDVDHIIIWNEVASNMWFDYTPNIAVSGPYGQQDIDLWNNKILRMMNLARAALSTNHLLYISLDQLMTPPIDQTRGHIGSQIVLQSMINQVGLQYNWSIACHFYGPPDISNWPTAAHFIDAPQLTQLVESQLGVGVIQVSNNMFPFYFFY